MPASEFRRAQFHVGSYSPQFSGQYRGFDIICSGESEYNIYNAMDTSHAKSRLPMVYAGGGKHELATMYMRWSCDVPPGATGIEKIIFGALASVPNTTNTFRLAVYDMDATPTLYTSSQNTISESHSYTASIPYYREMAPGADFTLNPLDVKKAIDATGQGYPLIGGYVQITPHLAGYMYLTEPVICFKMSAAKRW